MIAVIHNYPDNENEPSSLQTRSSYGEIIVEETNHWKHFEKSITQEIAMAPKIHVCFASFSFV